MTPRGYSEAEREFEERDIDEQENIGIVTGDEEGEISERNAGENSRILDQVGRPSGDHGNRSGGCIIKADCTK